PGPGQPQAARREQGAARPLDGQEHRLRPNRLRQELLRVAARAERKGGRRPQSLYGHADFRVGRAGTAPESFRTHLDTHPLPLERATCPAPSGVIEGAGAMKDCQLRYAVAIWLNKDDGKQYGFPIGATDEWGREVAPLINISTWEFKAVIPAGQPA